MYRLKKTEQVLYFIVMYFLPILLTISTTVGGSEISRIVGGHDAGWGKYPYQVSVRTSNFHICGGSIINHYYVLTAAHCIYQKISSNINVLVETNSSLNSGIIYNAEKLMWHNKYDKTTHNNDIGLIRVNKNIKFNIRAQPIPLADAYSVPSGQNATVTGWGQLNGESHRIPNALQVINVTVISQRTCQQMYRQLTENHICTLTKKNEGVCYGDSGGPLVLRGKQIGIVSYGVPCALGFPDVYTRVYPYKNWINNVMSSGSDKLPMNLKTLIAFLVAISIIAPHLHPLS